jgi:hypothetical protein
MRFFVANAFQIQPFHKGQLFGLFYDYLLYFLAYFFPFWYVVPRKIRQPWCGAVSRTVVAF